MKCQSNIPDWHFMILAELERNIVFFLSRVGIVIAPTLTNITSIFAAAEETYGIGR
jgi:hypothetical protein